MDFQRLIFIVRDFSQRLKHARDFKAVHISLLSLVTYSLKQLALNAYYSSVVQVHDSEYDELYCVSVGNEIEIYFPKRSFSRHLLFMLLREALDSKHWHQYVTPWTPLAQDDVVLDCGSAEGLWAYINVNKVRKVYLVEPQPIFCKALRHTFEGFLKASKVEILNVALGSSDGYVSMSDSGKISAVTRAKGSSCVNVELRRIDDLPFADEITFIKMDVEGCELDVLKSAHSTIRIKTPKIAVATYHDTGDWQAIRDLVLDMNPAYCWRLKGINRNGKPMMIHFYRQISSDLTVR